MASYTFDQLNRDGAYVEVLSGTKTFTLTNPSSGSAYFTIETVRDSNGFYNSSSSTNALGTYSSFTSIDEDSLVTSSYIASVVVPKGGGSFQFAPDVTVEVSSSRLRATGGISLVISGGGYDISTQALLDQATTDGYTAASGISLTALDTFIGNLKTDGIWDLLDCLWLPATNGDSDFACYNLKDPTTFKLTKVNSPTFTSLEGFTGDGVSSYLSTGFDLGTSGVNYQPENGSIGSYHRTLMTVGDGYLWLNNTAYLRRISSTNRYVLKMQGNGARNYTGNQQVGFHVGYKNSITNIGVYLNGGILYTSTDSTISQSGDLLLIRNADSQVSFAFIGADTTTKASDFYTAIQTYMTAIGKQV